MAFTMTLPMANAIFSMITGKLSLSMGFTISDLKEIALSEKLKRLSFLLMLMTAAPSTISCEIKVAVAIEFMPKLKT